jgi:hypothetical protein
MGKHLALAASAIDPNGARLLLAGVFTNGGAPT